jgi:DNA-binding transcriptional MerR regulator
MKMRELEARTGVHRETIRIYLRNGVVPEPTRPKPNVADYGEGHVRAVLAVRELQRERRMTLAQILEFMRGGGSTQRVDATAFLKLEELVAARVDLSDRRVATGSLVDQNPHAVADARAMAKIGLVSLVKTPAGEELSLTDARLVSIWGGMRAVGLVDAVDFAPDIIGFYIAAAEYVAGQEAGNFIERTEGRISDDQAEAMLQVALPSMLEFFGLLRLKAFMRNIHREPDAPAGVAGQTPPWLSDELAGA